MAWLAAALLASTPALAASLAKCPPGDASTIEVGPQEADAHRRFERPVISFPTGTPHDAIDGYFDLTIDVDAAGRPTCQTLIGVFDGSVRADVETLRAEIAQWRYLPFERGGRPVPVRLTQPVDAQILPARSVPVPPIDADRLTLTVVRAGCFDGCPEYAVTIRGDGAVGYVGMEHVDVAGTHGWRVPAADVAPLVAMARDPLLWSVDDTYTVDALHQETTLLRVDAGGHRKQVLAYGGRLAGMPVVISRLQAAIDDVAKAKQWTSLSHAALDRLEREGFDFHSAEAGAMLTRSVSFGHGWQRGRESADTSAILRLLLLGAPVAEPRGDGGTPLEIALRHRHSALIESLIERTFPPGETPSQAQLDAAFAAAIKGGRLSDVQRIWDAAGGRLRPSLEIVDPTNPDLEVVKHFPVVMLLDGRGAKGDWEGLEIARWLAERGVDLTAKRKDGRTVLQIAAEADDAEFFLWLLEQGADPRPLGDTELMEIGVRLGEHTALALLEAQARQGGEWRLAPKYRFVAELQEWPRVLAWLDAHPEVKERPHCCGAEY